MSEFDDSSVPVSARSKSPSQIQEVTMDPQLNFTTSSNSPSTYSSPTQGRTMKDYEEQISSLRKENFNLKLNVYFLEERLYTSHTPASQDNILKRNIELKIDLENLHRDLNEKQELLCAAAKALELMETSAARKEAELLSQISSMEVEIHRLKDTIKGINYDMDDASDVNACSVMGVDDSVALYAAAFNLKPTAREVESLHKKPCESEISCECHQLRALLTVERENAMIFKDNISSQEKQIADLKQQIQSLETEMKSSTVQIKENNISDNENNEDKPDGDVVPQIERLQKENLNACQMIQGCLVRIKQLDRENKKIKNVLQQKDDIISKLQAEECSEQVIDRFKDTLNIRDNKILELETQLKLLSSTVESHDSKTSYSDEKHLDCVNSHLTQKINTLRESICPKSELVDCQKKKLEKSGSIDIQQMLVKRLQEMAYFFDTLLSNRCIVGEEKQRRVEDLLEKTIELPLGLELDPNTSHILEETLADCIGRPSHSFKLEDLTLLFGHHMPLNESSNSHKIKYKHLQESNNEKLDLENIIEHQKVEIEMLNSQIKRMQANVLYKTTVEDVFDENKDSSLKLCNEFDQFVGKNTWEKNFNSTWNGFESQIEHSELECWSEPDRNVSLARMGGPLKNCVKDNISSEDEIYSNNSKNSHYLQRSANRNNSYRKIEALAKEIKKMSEEKKHVGISLEEARIKIMNMQNRFDIDRNKFIGDVKVKDEKIYELSEKLKQMENLSQDSYATYTECIHKLETDINNLKIKLCDSERRVLEVESLLAQERSKYEKQQKIYNDEIKNIEESSTNRIKEIQERIDIDWVSRARYETLRRELDNGALQASQATLDKAAATEQKIRSDTEAERLRTMLSEARLKISELESLNSQLQNNLVCLDNWQSSTDRSLSPHVNLPDSSPHASSSDLGIEGDHMSLVELVEPTSINEKYSAADLASENAYLREQLKRTRRELESIQPKLSRFPHKVQVSMCQEIHKTYSLLRQVRDNLNYKS